MEKKKINIKFKLQFYFKNDNIGKKNLSLRILLIFYILAFHTYKEIFKYPVILRKFHSLN